jgi:hypothetical protein
VSLFRDPVAHSYTAFGLAIRSELAMPEFAEPHDPTPPAPDLTFCYGRVPAPQSPTDRPVRAVRATDDGVVLYWNRIGAFLVQRGSCVTIDPVDGADERLVRLVLTGPVLGVILAQRGCRVFHGAVVVPPDRGCAVGIVAHKGEGKSTLAAALYGAGYSMMSDDIMAVRIDDGSAVVLSAFPQAKLWAESAAVVVDEPDELPRLGPDFDKRGCRIVDRFGAEPLSLGVVIALDRGERSSVIRLTGFAAVRALLPHWYGALFDGQLMSVLGPDRHFRETADLAGHVPVYSLTRPWSLARLSESVSAVDRLVRRDGSGLEPT